MYVCIYGAYQSGLVLWYCLEWPWKAGNYRGTGIWIVLVLLGRRILDGKPGVPRRGTRALSQSSMVPKGIKLRSSVSCCRYVRNQHIWVTTRTCSIGKPGKGHRACRTPCNLLTLAHPEAGSTWYHPVPKYRVRLDIILIHKSLFIFRDIWV